ncbi:hypothetical protein [Cellulosimicrobium cellulans]|uniref:hypothetical protein n=1 Tax=Cellulosimicrobium cellulans TaxID=1710 RepID=UPI00130DB324|nr:hypothetical protein [Cellulosimicrobium cellulans]
MSAAGSVVVDPAVLDVTGISPGAAVVREVTVRNDSGVPVLLAWTQHDQGALFEAAVPLDVGYGWDGAAACEGRPVVPAGEILRVRVEVALPAAAGDELQGATGASTLAWTATALPGGECPSGAGPGGPGAGAGPGGGGGGTGAGGGSGATAADPGAGALGATGGEVGALALAAAVLLAAGVLLVRGALRGRSRCAAA